MWSSSFDGGINVMLFSRRLKSRKFTEEYYESTGTREEGISKDDTKKHI